MMVVFIPYTVQSHINKVCVKENVKFLAYIPVFILNSTSFWSAATGYTFLQNRSMDILEEIKIFSDDRKLICVMAGISVYERYREWQWLH